MLDTKGRYKLCNELQANDFGLSRREDVEGKTNYELPVLKNYPRIIEELEKNNKLVLKERKSMEFYERFPRLNGGMGDCKSYKIPYFVEGKIIGIIGISFDLSKELEKLETLKHEVNEKDFTLSNIINHLPEHIYWLDKNNIFLGCNAEQARDFGLKDSSEVIGLHVSSFQTEENAQVIIKNNNHVMQTGKTIASEEDFLNNKGQKVYYLSKKSPLRDSMGKIIGTLGISFDITKEKQAEIIKRDFLSNMEHDLRTPFSGIGGIADLLNSCYADKYPELKEFFAIMTKSCTQWQEIHNRIFDALDLGQELKIESFYLQDEMEKIQDLMAASAKMKNIELHLEYPKKETTGPIKSDVLKIKLILSSLVGNAINFTEKGKVTLKLERNKNNFIIEVIDTGIGIPSDKLKYIFEKFTKLKRSNTYGDKFKGMGLGLYNAQKDAAKIQGSISVTSKVGKGSIFKLKLAIKMKKT